MNSYRQILYWLVAILVAFVFAPHSASSQTISKEKATAEMHRAVKFFREECSASGSYVFQLSADLTKREGEGKVGRTTGWLEPPATPSVGMAYTEAYLLTEDPVLKEAAIETAMSLVRCQLVSGGWYDRIEFAPEDRVRYRYRVDEESASGRKAVNQTTFDDDKSQSAARFLMQLDSALNFENETIHEAALYAVDSFVKAQYANGAWPQRYETFPEPSQHQPIQATFPEKWSREFPKRDYKSDYTLNDDTISDVIQTMLAAWETYNDARYLESARKGGDFFLLAQLPQPQPGWAQQYDSNMQPVWARKFEPPAITGAESQGVIRTLMVLYQQTGDRKYMEPIPRAIKYYRDSEIADNQLARFYEIGTNKPLYFTKDYRLTYADDDMPTHYAFKVSSKLDRLEADYQRLLTTPKEKLYSPKKIAPPRMSADIAKRADQVIKRLDDRGAWVESGKLKFHGEDDKTDRVIQSKTFCQNLLDVARYVGARE